MESTTLSADEARPVRSPSRIFPGVLLGVTLIFLWPWAALRAAPVTSEQAGRAVRAALLNQPPPLRAALGARVANTKLYADADDTPLYYIVQLDPEGFAVVAGDDRIEPIVAFTATGHYVDSDDHPLGALVRRDLRHRRQQLDEPGRDRSRESVATAKWRQLLADADAPGLHLLSGVSDLRVEPLVTSTWGQALAQGQSCYNYYTPPHAPGATNNYVCGCVATAMAQLMRFHEHPTMQLTTGVFQIYVDDQPATRTLRGGDGTGGPYDWADMPLNPGSGLTETQRAAIGALTHDAGVSVNMSYRAGGSGAYTSKIAARLIDVFGYAQTAVDYGSEATDRHHMLNPGLDAGLPSVLSIHGNAGGHAVVCDGYGYHHDTLYHHLNLGWNGTSDAWYNLPLVDTSTYTFDAIGVCIYNVFAQGGGGEIVSGRVTDRLDTPLEGAWVELNNTSGSLLAAVETNERGIWAATEVPSQTTVTVTVSKNGYLFDGKTTATLDVYVDATVDYVSVGNVWGVDCQSTSESLPRCAWARTASSLLEHHGTAALDVGLTFVSTETVTVQCIVTGGTAVEGEDYTLVDNTVVFDAGRTTASLSIAIEDDAQIEMSETIEITLTASDRAIVSDPIEHVVTIIDNDTPLGQAVEGDQWAWATSGDAAWFGQTETSQDGWDAAQSGAIQHGQCSIVSAEVDGPGQVSFWWRLSAQEDGPRLLFHIDDDPATSLTLSTGWQLTQHHVAAGPHTLRWTFCKETGGNHEEDGGWLDAIYWNPDPLPPPGPSTTGARLARWYR